MNLFPHSDLQGAGKSLFIMSKFDHDDHDS